MICNIYLCDKSRSFYKQVFGTIRPKFEFHILKEKREFYQVDEALFQTSGNVIFTDYYQVRLLAQKINKKRDVALYPEMAVKAGQINAVGLIDEILHFVIGLYKEAGRANVFSDALGYLEKNLGKTKTNNILKLFTDLFPPTPVFKGKMKPSAYLSNPENRAVVLEEILMLYVANANPAFSPLKELFDDEQLNKQSAYHDLITHLNAFFTGQAYFGPEDQMLVEMLCTPARRVPHSLKGQLEFILSNWGILLSKFISRLFTSLDIIKEEEKPSFFGSAPTKVIDFSKLQFEPEMFSKDLDWMPNVVMIAKSTYVWLNQLSKKYQRSIARLNDIPDEELDILAQRGFTALWLIGLWERSPASRRIKQWRGNPEAESSAYSLYDYTIAHDLGGDGAYNDLKNRAWKRGIRLASDMVPNHTGIYSKWVVEHPDWFIQSRHSPFPGYNFTGDNLCDDDRIGIYIEDGYWHKTDAAVVFKRVDHHTGDVRFIYHGNDGTSMPWNDTAQLNFLLPQVRESVIQTIIHVARMFPIIRLDAAMTLAKKHFQRLWFPQPGSGGDIPSRAEQAISFEAFNEAFPVEFWREVVDRVATEAPDTLLLAEAFWMMEGYFVRTLGMHRVYNSAFMNMLKNEENQKYRDSIKSVMHFNPEIMKRYVNFMNNPDEETAVTQFGKDDKYFGVCTLMVTLPGLPMFGHGQIEGFTEKYGMEYRRAYWDEQEDQHLIRRHEREIFPLLKKRYLFSQARNFVLYDLYTEQGTVNENVFAYTNRAGDERCLVVYNNKYDRTRGWIKNSSASAQKSGDIFIQYNLQEGLGLSGDNMAYTIFRDHSSGIEYLRKNSDLAFDGLYVELDGFKYHVFLDFRQVFATPATPYDQLAVYLNGRGVPNIQDSLRKLILSPIHQPFNGLVKSESDQKVYIKDVRKFLDAVCQFTGLKKPESFSLEALSKRLELTRKGKQIFKQSGIKKAKILKELEKSFPDKSFLKIGFILRILGVFYTEQPEMHILALIDELHLHQIIRETNTGDDPLLLLKSLILTDDWFNLQNKSLKLSFEELLQVQEVRDYIQVNRYQEVLYCNKERLEELLTKLLIFDFMNRLAEEDKNANSKLSANYMTVQKIRQTAESCGYRIDLIVRELGG